VPVLSEMFGPIPRGRVIAALYDADSQFNPLFVNISAEYLRSGGDLLYLASSRPPNEIRMQFSGLGLDIADYEARDNAVLVDSYSAQMGIKSSEKYQTRESNLNERSITISESAPQWPAGTLVIGESFSDIALHQENVFGKFWRKAVGRWKNQGHHDRRPSHEPSPPRILPRDEISFRRSPRDETNGTRRRNH